MKVFPEPPSDAEGAGGREAAPLLVQQQGAAGDVGVHPPGCSCARCTYTSVLAAPRSVLDAQNQAQ